MLSFYFQHQQLNHLSPQRKHTSSVRQLAAILFADIAGYTSLMQKDEAKALICLNKFKAELESRVPSRNGKIIQFYGDGCLVIFNSSVDSVNCAMELQTVFREEPKVPVRIGLHAGDIVLEEGNVYGDAVNIANRVESLGVPGAILLSSSVRNQIKNQSDFKLSLLGRFEFKNVEGSMSVYALANEGFKVPDSKHLSGKLKTEKSTNKIVRKSSIGILSLIILIVLAYFYLPSDSSVPNQRDYDAIAIFPFDVKGSQDIQYLGAGMVDLISTKLDEIPEINSIDPNVVFSKLNDEFDIARNPEKAARLSQSLNANKFILGSIVEVGEEFQITASIYDVSGKFLEKLNVDGNKSSGLSKAIDELVRKLIAKEMLAKGHELSGLGAITTENMESLKAYLKGEQAFRSGYITQASDYFNEAVRHDSTFALAWMRIIHADGWDITESVPDAYTNWKKYRHKLPKKWQEYQDAFLLFKDGNQNARFAFENLIRKYGESRAFINGLGEYLYHFNPVYGKSRNEAKPYFQKTLELDPHNIEAFAHLSDIARNQKDTASIRKMISAVKEDSEMFTKIRINELMVQDSFSDLELEKVLRHPNLSGPDIFKMFYPFDDGTFNMNLIKSTAKIFDDEGFNSLSEGWQLGFRGKEILSFDNFEKQVELMPYFPFPLDKYRRCLPATFMVDREFLPFEDHYEILFKELNDKDSPWEMYAAIKYAIALNKEKEIDKWKSRLLAKSQIPEFKNQALYYHFSIKAFEAYLEGKNEIALTYIDSAFQHSFGFSEIQTSCYDKTIMRANIHAKNGEFESAIAYFENFPVGIGYQNIHGYILYKLGEWYEQTGNLNEALHNCNLLLDYYQDCDEKYRPWVEETQKRRDRIISKIK